MGIILLMAGARSKKPVNYGMTDMVLYFEKSEVEAEITTPVVSIKNPRRGTIRVPAMGGDHHG